MQTPLVIAHRGDSSRGLENSLDAFRLALDIPVDMIELDVRMSGDGVLYVMHDRNTGRTASHDLNIEQASSREIDTIKLANGESIPRLAEVFQLTGNRAGINIEIKSDGAGKALARQLKEVRPACPLVISSFKEAEISAVRSELPDLPASLIYDTFSPRHVSAYHGRGFSLVSLRKNTVTEQLVRACHKAGVQMFVWTVDDEDVMKRCIEWKVDGIYTNKPLVLRELIRNVRGVSKKQ